MSELRDREADICVKEASSRYLPVAELGLGAPSDRTFRVAETVPPGYKLTEVGVIPEDWDVMPLAQLTEIRTGIAKNSNVEVGNPVQVYYLRVANVQDGFLDISDLKTLEINRNNIKRYEVLPGDVLMNEGGDLDKLGRGAIWRGEFAPCVHQNHVFVVRCSSRLSPDYLNAWTGGKSARRYFMVAGKQTTNLATINKTALGLLPIVLPTKAEQESIAEALSDADALIEALEQLIAKKRQLKQGTMQELLTGKRRLPGFSGEWEAKRLGTVLKFQVGFPFSSIYFNEEGQGVRLVKNRDLKNDGQVFFYSGKYDQEFLIKNGDVLIGMDGDFLPCLWRKGNALLNQRVGRIVPHTGLNGIFAFYYLIEPLKEIENSTSSTTVKHLSHGDIEGIEKLLPSEEEQTAIAKILSDMDTEITALESKLTKARAVKQGMMQQLLTGKIRLVVNPKPIIDN